MDTLPGIHDVFYTRLLKPATTNPLPGQVLYEPQPPALRIDDDDEYRIDEILA